MTRTTSALGILAALLLFLSMFAGLFGSALSQGSTAPERQCTNCFRWGTGGAKGAPTAGQSNNATIVAVYQVAAWRRCGAGDTTHQEPQP